MAEFDEGELIFSFAMADRDEKHQKDYTSQGLGNVFEYLMQLEDGQLFSDSTELEETFIRDFGYRNDTKTILGRIFVRKTRFWIINAVFTNGKENDPRVKYFFEQFNLSP